MRRRPPHVNSQATRRLPARRSVGLTPWVALVLAIVGIAPLAYAEDDGKPINVIVLLADDLGWNGLGYSGSDLHQTPNLDKLARQGVRFTDAYAACTVCSPTRAALMTGMYPARLHLTDWIAGQKRPHAKLRIPDWTQQLEHRYVTLAEAFQQAGYVTAHVGKWHLGGPDYYPEKHGFDINIGGNHSGGPQGGYFLPNRMTFPDPPPKKGEYLTDRLTDEAIRIIEANRAKPFFLYFPYYTVHTPIQGKKSLQQQALDAMKQRKVDDPAHSNAVYAAMHASLDESIGRLMATLDRLKLTGRTAVIFTSDNGGLSHKFGKRTGITRNKPLRRGKGAAYEGGIRVPMIVRAPGIKVDALGAVCTTPVITMDIYNTALALAGVKQDPKQRTLGGVDGIDIQPLLRDPRNGTLPRDAIYWHYPHYHAGGDSPETGKADGPWGAVRMGDFKLIEFYEDNRVELYNVRNDVGESKNLAAVDPERTQAMRQKLVDWRKSVGAQMPTVNPDYDPARAMRGPSKNKKPQKPKK